MNYLAELREEPDSSEGSSADEEAAAAGAGWTGTGKPVQIGVHYTVRDFSDGQSLASPGRWPPATRQYPCSDTWTSVSELVRRFSEHYGTTQLLMDLALGRVEKCPFPCESVRELKGEIIGLLSSRGLKLNRASGDRNELPIDFRFLAFLLRASEDPDTQLGNFAQDVKVGPGTRMPRNPALYKPKRKWRLEQQRNPQNWLLEDEAQAGSPLRHASLVGFADKVEAVLEDQAGRGQVLKFTEAEARARFPNLVVASLGAQRKDKPNGVVSARVLFDGTYGMAVNTHTRIRNQEQPPIATDLKRAMREKAELGQPTFALTADVSEAHRQVPVHPSDWHFLGCQVTKSSTVYVNTVGTFGITSASYYWNRVGAAVGRISQYLVGRSAATWHMLVADDYHLAAGGEQYRFALIAFFVVCALAGVPLSWNKTCHGTKLPAESQ